MFPEYNNRAARLISLGDRIVDCFLRSENATGRFASQADAEAGEQNHPDADEALSPASKEVLAVVRLYRVAVAQGYAVGANPAWRGQNAIASDKLVARRVARSRAAAKRCSWSAARRATARTARACRSATRKPGPLWGPDSWNDGAGAARVYTLAGIIRYTMPYLDPGSLSDEEAQHVAAFINSKPRPQYPNKASRLPRREGSGRRGVRTGD